jgi:LacI family transcriptional regulator
MAAPYRIQVVIDSNLTYFREAILGVRQYAFSTGRLILVDRWLEHERSELSALVRRDKVQGIVAAIHRPEIERKYCSLGIPVVNVSNTMPSPLLAVVTQDDQEVGRLAGQHLAQSGCRQFAFLGQHQGLYSMKRLEGFSEVVAAEGGTVEVLNMLPLYGRREYSRILRWLSRKTPPIGVFAVLDEFALMVLRAAHELGWRVPDDVSVLGAGDDEFLVGFERTPLSSIKLPARAIGYTAGAEIDRLISGGAKSATSICLDPIGLVPRQSTDTLFISDEVVVKAIRYIRSNASQTIYIADIAKVAGIALTTLQKRFNGVVGHSMLEEIQRVRIALAKALLRFTDLSLEAISERCGFSNAQRFSVIFRTRNGVPPGQFRRAAR